MQTLALFGPLGTWELIVLALLGLLIFGRRLPEVGRGLGRSIVEFRKGLKGVEEEIDTETSKPANLPQREPSTVIRSPLAEQPIPQNPPPPASA